MAVIPALQRLRLEVSELEGSETLSEKIKQANKNLTKQKQKALAEQTALAFRIVKRITPYTPYKGEN